MYYPIRDLPLHGDQVVAAGDVDSPVVVVVAGCRPAGVTINLRVGDGDTVGGTIAKDNVLAADEGGLDVVNPNEVAAVEGNSITTPDILRVQVGDVDVLNNDVLHAAGDTETLANNDTSAALPVDGLVGANLDGVETGLVVPDTSRCKIRIREYTK
jgi:hypothetical protein